jgi:hypothetical protein
MSLKLNSVGGGSVTLQEPSTASNLTLDLPATAGTMALTSQIPAAPSTELGAIGTYAFCATESAVTLTPGITIAGSGLRYAASGNSTSGGNPPGTWRLMGGNAVSGSISNSTLWVRIS